MGKGNKPSLGTPPDQIGADVTKRRKWASEVYVFGNIAEKRTCSGRIDWMAALR
jgi:hypothetical protein